MKILAVLQNPGYLRHYGGVLVELTQRGHDVRVSFTDERRMREGLAALGEAPLPIPAVKDVPKRRDFWQPFAVGLRNTTAYVRYLDPRLEASYVRTRLDRLPRTLGFLRRIRRLPKPMLTAILRALVAAEQAVPPSRGHEAWLRELSPDVVFVSPVVQDLGQADVFKAARSVGIPSVLGIASWDHLTTKGLVTVRPERILVWNELQRQELRDLHLIDDSSVVVTGSQSFDPWFEREPSRSRAAFCRGIGLPPDKPYLLYVGSFRSIAEAGAEQRFVDRWLELVRAHPGLEDVAVLVRPHPYNSDGWDEQRLERHGDVVVWSHAAYPVHEAARSAYFDSLYHSAAVVGINTSALLEAAIVGRPVLTMTVPEFADTQSATVHFRYLVSDSGGFLQTASEPSEHLVQLRSVLDAPPADDGERLRFVESFVRPRGLGSACTPLVAEAIESAAAVPLNHIPTRPRLRALLAPLAAVSWAANPKARKRALKPFLRLARRGPRRVRRVYRHTWRPLRRRAYRLKRGLWSIARIVRGQSG